jgi:hypothetical protein
MSETMIFKCAKCQSEVNAEEYYSFGGQEFCNKCYFEKDELGPFASQYKTCPHCQTKVNVFTIRCFKCNTQVHETGTISTKRPTSSMVIMIYGLVALILLIAAFTIPTFSDKGPISWFSTIAGLALAAHGLLGFFFFFLPFGFFQLDRFKAFGFGTIEAAIGLYLLMWPKL